MRHAFIICAILAVASPAAAAPFAYATTIEGDFGVLDLGSGAYVHCGYTGTALFGLAVGPHGVLYGMDTGYFYRVNPHTGALTHIAPAANYRVALGSAANLIYAVDSNANLFTVDPETGAEAAAGSGAPAPAFVFVLSAGAQTLYESTSAGLYDFIPKQGVAHRKNRDHSVEWGGLALVDRVLYGVGTPTEELPQYIYTIDTQTGTATQHAPLAITVSQITGVAPAASDNTGTCRVTASSD